MKKLVIVLIVMAFSLNTLAQIDRARITYDIIYQSGETGVVSIGLDNFQLIFTYDKHHTRVVMDMDMLQMQSVIDYKKNRALILIDMMGEHKGMEVEGDDFEKIDKNFIEDAAEINYTDEVKTILNFTCKLAIGISSDGKKVSFYTTDKIEGSKKFNILGLSGFPLEFTSMDDKGQPVTFRAVKVETEFEDLFETNLPAGYTILSKEERKEILNGTSQY